MTTTLQEMLDKSKQALDDSRVSLLAGYLVENHRQPTSEAAVAYIRSLGARSRDALDREVDAYRLRTKREREAEQKRGALRAAYNAYCAEIPARYAASDVRQLSGKMADIASHILANRSGLFIGEIGIGKTHLLWAVAKKFMERGERSLIVKAGPMLGKIKFSYQGDDECYGFAERQYGANVKHLFIDEVDKISATDADFRYLSHVIDYRYERLLQTVIMGNNRAGMTARDIIGAASYSRLAGEGGWAFELRGTDRRIVEVKK